MMFFWIIAVALIGAALLFLLPPLFLRNQQEQTLDRKDLNVAVYRDQLTELDNDLRADTLSQEQYQQARQDLEKGLLESVEGQGVQGGEVVQTMAAKSSAWFLILALPLVSLFLYAQLGGGKAAFNPELAKPNVEAEGHDGNMEQMVIALQQRLEENPGDFEGWAMLGRSYYFLRQFEPAADAYAKALELGGQDNADLWADYADTLALTQGRSLRGQPMEAIKRALVIDPSHVKGLWLAGTGAYEMQDYRTAKGYWERLLKVLPPGSDNARMIESNLAELNSMIGGGGAAQPAMAAQVSGKVSLAGDLASRTAPDDTLFIFARAAEGPPVPLAILRKQARDLPLEFTLDDTMAMNPAMKLSNFQEIIVGARISKSGMAMAQAGDLQGMSKKLRLDGKTPVTITIDTVVK